MKADDAKVGSTEGNHAQADDGQADEAVRDRPKYIRDRDPRGWRQRERAAILGVRGFREGAHVGGRPAIVVGALPDRNPAKTSFVTQEPPEAPTSSDAPPLSTEKK